MKCYLDRVRALFLVICFCYMQIQCVHCEFPALKGMFNVGTLFRYCIDEHREDPHNPLCKRELMIRLWYPSYVHNQRSSYVQLDGDLFKALLHKFGYSQDFFDGLCSLSAQVNLDAPAIMEHAPFPIIIFSHGFINSCPTMYSVFCQELASHGYVVAAIAHTYYAGAVTFPDGRRIGAAPEKLASFRRGLPGPPEQKIWMDDVAAVINYLAVVNDDSQDPLFSVFDFKRIGMFGHSFGGAIAFKMCLEDEKFKAGISLDGLLFGDSQVNSMCKPFRFLLAQETIETSATADEEVARREGRPVGLIKEKREEFEKLRDAASSFITSITINNLKHAGFTDFLFLKETSLLEIIGIYSILIRRLGVLMVLKL